MDIESKNEVTPESDVPQTANNERIDVIAAPAGAVVSPDLSSKQVPMPEGSIEITGATVVEVKNTKKRVFIIVLVLAVLLGIAAVYYFVLHKDNKSVTSNTDKQVVQQVAVSSAGAAVNYSPRFTAVYSYVDYAGAKWYAVSGGVIKVAGENTTFYSQSQGVPNGTPQKLVVHNNQLWLASQGGVAYLASDGATFTESKVEGLGSGLRNGDLFYDTSAKKLYLNDFEGLYVYNDSSKKWDIQNGPKNLRSFAANDKYIAAYGSKEGWPIWVYDKAKSQWSVKSPALEEQSATAVAIDGNIFLLGRSKGYTSCDSVGKVTATSAFILDTSGNWQPLTAFNSDKARPELMITRSVGSQPHVRTYVCENNGKSKSYDLTYKDNTIVLANEKVLTTEESGYSTNLTEQKLFIADLIKATKLHPSIHVLDVDGKGNVVFSFSDEFSDSSTANDTAFAVADKNVFSQSTVIDMSLLKEGTNYPVMCGVGEARKLGYIFSGIQHIQVGGGEGFPDGLWNSGKLYKVDGTKVTLAADLGVEVSYPAFMCSDKEVVWLGKTGLRRMARDTNKVDMIGAALTSKITYRSSAFAATSTGNAWFSFSTSPDDSSVQAASTLYFYDSAKGTYAKVAAKINVQSIQAATDKYALVYANNSKEPLHTVYDSTGKAVQTLATGQSAFPAVVASGKDNEFLVLTSDASASDSLFTPFVVNKLVAGNPFAKVTVTNAGFKTMYTSGGGSIFGLVGAPYVVADNVSNKLWLSDDLFGINAVTLP